MKILAIIDVVPGADLGLVRQHLDDELRASWRLLSDDVLREAHATATPSRVVFVLETADVPEAQRRFSEMPLVTRGLLAVELIELRPFTNWSRLFATQGS